MGAMNYSTMIDRLSKAEYLNDHTCCELTRIAVDNHPWTVLWMLGEIYKTRAASDNPRCAAWLREVDNWADQLTKIRKEVQNTKCCRSGSGRDPVVCWGRPTGT